MRPYPVSWSWIGLVAAVPVAGAVLIPLMWGTDQFRRGLDADVLYFWATLPAIAYPPIILLFGLCGAPFLILAYWIVRFGRLGRRSFLLLSAGIPAVLLLGHNLSYVIGEMIEPTRGVVPFESTSLGYLPNYLQPLSLLVAMTAAALVYLRIATARPAKALLPMDDPGRAD